MNYHSIIFSEYLSDEAVGKIVSDETLIAKMLQFEAALAKALATLDIIPKQSADEICEAANRTKIEPAELAGGTLQNGIPVITFLSLIKNHLTKTAQQYLHYGATSQDVMDTAQVMIIRDALVIIEEKLNSLINSLTLLLNRYTDIPCTAHTRGQQAMPITFGAKIKAWLLPLQRQIERITPIKKRLFIVQLGGAAGTLSVYGDKGQLLVDVLANELKLQSSASWHTQRDNFCEFTNWLAMLTGILGKMGADILVMSQSEINEITENAEGGGKSSAMPHKNNPVLSEALVAIARISSTLQMQQLQSLVHANERDATAWILEWNAIPQMLINAGTVLNHAITIAQKMKLNTDNMQKNVEEFLKKQKE